MSQITGIVYVKLDGQLMRSEPGARLKLGGKQRTARVGHSVYGFSEAVVQAEVEFTMLHVGGDDLIGIQNKVDSTLEFITDTGDTYLVSGAFCVNPAEIAGGEGQVPWIFHGNPAEVV